MDLLCEAPDRIRLPVHQLGAPLLQQHFSLLKRQSELPLKEILNLRLLSLMLCQETVSDFNSR